MYGVPSTLSVQVSPSVGCTFGNETIASLKNVLTPIEPVVGAETETEAVSEPVPAERVTFSTVPAIEYVYPVEGSS